MPDGQQEDASSCRRKRARRSASGSIPPLSGFGDVDFGAMGGQSLMPPSLDVDGETLRFFDYWLRGIDDGIANEPPVRLFVMSTASVWR
jgi:hypothetical protein